MDNDRLPPPRSAYRAMGRSSAWERLGVGVMDKAGRSLDHDDYSPATYSLVYVLRGRGSYQLADGQHWDMQAGDCFQRLPGLRHTTHVDPGSRWLEAWIDLGPILYRALADMQVIRNSPLVWRWGLSPVRVARFTTLLSEISEAGQRDLPDLCVRCQALIVEAQRGVDQHSIVDDPIERICHLLREESATRLDLHSFCRREGLDYEQVRKDFRHRLGVSPGQYRIRRRIERACALLHTTDQPVAAIADELGYHSAYEFSAQFRQWMGVPPSRYRER